MKLAVISTAICLLMGYPIAYIIARAAPRTQKTIITLIMIPMWMNFLIRTYAWMTILQDSGLLNMLFSALHLGQAHIIGTEGAVVVGMVYDYFPYMILPIYSVMAKMDTRLIEAARDLGCNSLGVLRRVIFPLSLPGVMSGSTMVLIPSISTFYISQKLGNGKFFLIGDAIEGQYVANNLHFAAAIAFILMLILLAACFINFMLSREAAVANAEYIYYASPNRLVYDDPEYIDDMGEDTMAILYPDIGSFRDAYNRSAYRNLDQDTLTYVNSLWETLKIN